MYITKVYFQKKLVDARLYEDYEHFISDLTNPDSELYCDLPEDYVFDPRRPFITSACSDELKFNTDFEYVYEDGLLIYCGQAMTEEEARR